MKKFINNNFYFILILLFIAVNFNSLEKIYILHLKDYNQRLLFAYGYCDKEGYGFVKKNINNEIINSNFYVENDGDFPSIKGFFYKFKSNLDTNTYIFLINQNQGINDDYLNNYKILKKEKNCYLLKKND